MRSQLPDTTSAELAALRERAELAEFEVDRAVFLDGVCDLEFCLLDQAAAAARARYEAAAAQRPDRTPFAGRRR